MANKRMLLFLLPLLSFSLLGAGPKKAIFLIEFDNLGPYEKYQDNPDFTFTLTNKASTEYFAYVTVTMGNDDLPNCQVVELEKRAAQPGGKITYTVPLITRMVLGDDGMDISISVKRASRTNPTIKSLDASIGINIFPISRTVLDPYQISNSGYRSQNLIAKKEGDSLTYTSERIHFVDWEENIYTNIYHKIPFEDIEIAYVGLNEIQYKEANMIISGYQHLFPNLVYQDNKTKIPLKITKKGSDLLLSFKNTLFVHPKLLLTSLEPLEGYVATNSLYLPVNMFSKADGLRIGFEVKELGIDKISFSWSMGTDLISEWIGECSDSQYCIVGERK